MSLAWKSLLKLEEDEILGLDIGSAAVKILQMRKSNSGFAVTAAAMASIQHNTDDDEAAKKMNIIRAVRQCLKSTGIQKKLAVCSVYGSSSAVRHFKFPALSQKETAGAIHLEAMQVCPFTVEQNAVSYQLMSKNKDGISGVLAAATARLIKEKVQIAQKSSLDCALVDVDGLALLNCLKEYCGDESLSTKAVLNVGHYVTTLAIVGDDGAPFIRDLAYGGDRIIKQIASENNLSVEDVHQLLYGNEIAGRDASEILNSLRNACRKLAGDIADTLRYYLAHTKSASIEKIFVCGGFALATGFLDVLNEQLPEELVLWNPFDRISCNTDQKCNDLLKKSGPAMAVACGLASRIKKDSVFRMDLLNGRGVPINKGYTGLVAAAITLLIPLIIAVFLYNSYVTKKITIEVEKQKLANYQERINKFTDILNLQRTLEREKATSSALIDEIQSSIHRHAQWSNVIATLAGNIPDTMVLTSLEVKQDFSKKDVPSRNDPKKSVSIDIPVRSLRVVLTGNRKDNCDLFVRNFKNRFSSSKIYGHELEDIKVSQQYEDVDGQNLVSYEIEFVFKPVFYGRL